MSRLKLSSYKPGGRGRARAFTRLFTALVVKELLRDLLNGGNRRESSLSRVVHQFCKYAGYSRAPTRGTPPPPRHAIGSHCRAANKREGDALLFKTFARKLLYKLLLLHAHSPVSARITLGTIFRKRKRAITAYARRNSSVFR